MVWAPGHAYDHRNVTAQGVVYGRRNALDLFCLEDEEVETAVGCTADMDLVPYRQRILCDLVQQELALGA